MSDQHFDPYAGLIWIREVKERPPVGYSRSETWLWEMIKEGRLDKKEVPGDRKTYLYRNQIEALLRDEPKPQPSTSAYAPPMA